MSTAIRMSAVELCRRNLAAEEWKPVVAESTVVAAAGSIPVEVVSRPEEVVSTPVAEENTPEKAEEVSEPVAVERKLAEEESEPVVAVTRPVSLEAVGSSSEQADAPSWAVEVI